MFNLSYASFAYYALWTYRLSRKMVMAFPSYFSERFSKNVTKSSTLIDFNLIRKLSSPLSSLMPAIKAYALILRLLSMIEILSYDADHALY